MPPVTRADHRRVALGPRSATDGPAAGTADLVLLCDPRITAIPVRDRGVSPSTSPWWGRGGRPGRRRPKPRPRAGTAGSPPGPRCGPPAPRGHRLLVVEGWRPMAEQARIRSTCEAQVLAWPIPARLAAEVRTVDQPLRLTCERWRHCERRRRRLTSPDRDGPVDMGTEIDATPETSGGACYCAYRDLADPARSNRPSGSGVATRRPGQLHPTEWWHWSFGDRYWAWSMGERSSSVPHVHPGHTIASGPAHPGRWGGIRASC